MGRAGSGFADSIDEDRNLFELSFPCVNKEYDRVAIDDDNFSSNSISHIAVAAQSTP